MDALTPWERSVLRDEELKEIQALWSCLVRVDADGDDMIPNTAGEEATQNGS